MGDVFVGRAREGARLRELSRTGPVTLVVGRGGIGKTAFVEHVLGARRPLGVGVRPGDDERAVWLALARALAARELVASADDSIGAVRTAVLEAADAFGGIVVVDDVHLLPRPVALALVARVRTAKRARWVLVGRAPWPPRFAPITITLDDLDRRALTRLARELAPRRSARERARLVALADGSPLLLRRALASRAEADPTEIVDALSKRARPLLELLAALDLCIAPETARAITGSPVPRHPDIVRTPEGVRLHDARRDLLPLPRATRGMARKLARSVASTDDVRAAFESVRLALEVGDVRAAAALLDRHLDAMVEEGLGERLEPLLLGRTERVLAELRLQLAVRLGGRALAQVLDDPRATTRAARVRHAEALIRASRLGEAKAILEAEPRSLEVDYLLGRALYFMGDFEGAAARLAPRRSDPRAKAQLARISATRGAYAEAIRSADELAVVEGESPFVRRQVETARIDVYASAGRLDQVVALLRRQLHGRLSSAQPWGNQVSLALLAQLEAERGALPAARRILAALRSPAERSATLRCECRAVEARILAAEGDLPAAIAITEEAVADAEARGHRVQAGWLRVLGAVLAGMAGRAPAPIPTPVHDAQARFVAALRRLHALRAGLPSEPLRAAPEPIDAHVFELLAEGTDALLQGAFGRAERIVRDAIATAEEHGYAVYAHEARRLLCDVATANGERALAEAEAERIRRWGATIGSKRFQLEGEMASLLLARDAPIAALERVAAATGVAPTAARRARALLGATEELDRVDARVLAACAYHGKVRSIGPVAEASWGVDVRSGFVWLPDGRRASSPAAALQTKILRSLVEAGGSIEKEQLVQRVWGIKDYHPLRDDKRLYVAIMRLRRALGAARIRSVPGGYALGSDEPVRVIVS
jgi:hypothetical protein